jgi:hypothetical protein
MTDAIGWVATVLFAGSYFFKRPAALRRTQALAATVWIWYGAASHAMPVVVANIIVAGLALWSSYGPSARKPVPAVDQPVREAGDSRLRPAS